MTSMHFDIATALQSAASEPVSMLLASTPVNVEQARDMSNKGQVDAVVADGTGGAVSPRVLLDRLDNPQPPQRIVIFTDQLCCPVTAPVLVSRGHQRRYLSGLELVLNGIHGFKLLAQARSGYTETAPAANAEQVLAAIWAHLDACADLGDGWLAKELQNRRTPEWRGETARRQIRLFHSSILHLSATHADIDRTHLHDLNHELTEARTKCISSD